jgi:ABC-2 type transport system permease protein
MELGKGERTMSDLENKNEKKRKFNLIDKIKASFSGRKFRSGAYVTIISAIVIVIVLVVNMLVTKMNIQFDLSSQSLYTLGKDTKNIVSDLKDDITIYYMVQPGKESDTFLRVAKKYDNLSDHIKLEMKDPVQYPTFASQYVDDDVAEDSFIVVNNSNNRAKYISGDDMLVQEPNYQTYSYDVTGMDVEGKLTSAILYVTTEDLPVLYKVEGHGETPTETFFSDAMDKANISVQTLSTKTVKSIPEDCDILFINSPTKDFSDDETAMIKDYLTAGGKAIITVDYYADELTNFKSILDYYGIELVNGFVVEGDSDRYNSNYPDNLLPIIESHEITAQANDSQAPVYMPLSSGLTISDTKRSSLTIEKLLSTSDSAFSRVNIESTNPDKEDGDIDGPFYLGLAATDTYNDVTSTIVVYSSTATFDDDTMQAANPELLSGTVNYLAGDANVLSIPAKSLVSEKIYPTQKQIIFWGAIVIFVIPAFIITVGIAVSLRRRKK